MICIRCGKETKNRLCRSCSVSLTRKRNKIALIELRGRKCEICGYDRCEASLVFHHIDPSNKNFSISAGNNRKIGFEHQLKEIDNCMLLCHNCHNGLHQAEQYEKDKKIIEQLNRERSEKTINRKCRSCGKEIKVFKSVSEIGKGKYCSMKCYGEANRKIKNRPEKEELKSLIENNSWLAIGRMFGVSDNAVRKWAREYKIM